MDDLVKTKLSFESVKRFEGRVSVENPKLFEEMKNLLSPSYDDITAIMEREDSHCRIVYYIVNDKGTVIAFFMINHEELVGRPSVYCGLSAVDQEFKNSGISTLIYLKATLDHLQLQKKYGEKYILYATTPSPSIFYSLNKLYNNVFPDHSGGYTDLEEKLAREYCIKYGITIQDNPFVLKAVAPGTFYSDLEKERIKKLIEKHDFRLFEKLGINAEKGDRLLIMFELSSEEYIHNMIKGLGLDA